MACLLLTIKKKPIILLFILSFQFHIQPIKGQHVIPDIHLKTNLLSQMCTAHILTKRRRRRRSRRIVLQRWEQVFLSRKTIIMNDYKID